MATRKAEDYLPKEYDKPEEDHVFNIRGRIFQGHTYAADRESSLFQILDVGDNFLQVFREYYQIENSIVLPDVKLFLIESPDVNAFAVYEECLNSYCIGIFGGVCEQLESNVRTSFERVSGILFPEEEAEEWYAHLFVQAIRFFVIHEYAHILCGHVTKGSTGAHFEFADGERTEDDNLIQQMKEFQADQMAMAYLCSMAYLDTQSQHNYRVLRYDEMEQQFWEEKFPDVPEFIRRLYLGDKRTAFVEESQQKRVGYIHKRLKAIMGGINVVFHTLDSNRKRMTRYWVERNSITQEEQESFLFRSGLSTMRQFDHPLPCLRLESVFRMMDESIEAFEPGLVVPQLEREVADFAWMVEVYRNEFRVDELYCHIPHTPTAQDFIQEMEALWQEKKHTFPAVVPPLVRLFYANRIVDMNDNGELILP